MAAFSTITLPSGEQRRFRKEDAERRFLRFIADRPVDDQPSGREPTVEELQDLQRQLEPGAQKAPPAPAPRQQPGPQKAPPAPPEQQPSRQDWESLLRDLRPGAKPPAPGPGRPSTQQEVSPPGRQPTLDPSEIGRRVGEDVQAIGSFFAEAARHAVQPRQMRSILTGLGAGAGGVFGTPAGPVGVVGGTIGGSAFGGYLANIYEEIWNAGEQRPDAIERLMRPVQDAIMDGTITGGMVALPFVARGTKALLGRLMHLPENSRQLLDEASRIGVDIGIANVATGGVGRGAVNVFGRVPIIGGAARKAAERQASQLAAAREDLFGRLANPREAAEVSEDAFRTATQRFDQFAVAANQRYERAVELGERAGQVIDTTGISTEARNVLNRLTRRPEGVQAVLPEKVRSYLESLAALDSRAPRISTIDLRGIDHDLENLARSHLRETGVSLGGDLNRVRQAGERALEVVSGGEGIGAQAAQALRQANSFYTGNLRQFESAIAQRFGRVERNVFSTGTTRPGTVEVDDFMRQVENVNSPQAVRDLRRLTGDEMVRNIGRARLDDAWVKATGIHPGTWGGERFGFDAGAFRQALGLNNRNSNRYAAMREMLEGTGTTMDDLERFARVAQAVTNAPIADASTFMARSTVLRGSGGIAQALRGALTLGTGAATYSSGGGIHTGGIAGVLLLRQGLGVMMRPRALRWLTDMADPQMDVAARRAAAVQFLANYPGLVEE